MKKINLNLTIFALILLVGVSSCRKNVQTMKNDENIDLQAEKDNVEFTDTSAASEASSKGLNSIQWLSDDMLEKVFS